MKHQQLKISVEKQNIFSCKSVLANPFTNEMALARPKFRCEFNFRANIEEQSIVTKKKKKRKKKKKKKQQQKNPTTKTSS